MKQDSENLSIHKLSKECPETLSIMKALGFKDIAKPGMLETVGRVIP